MNEHKSRDIFYGVVAVATLIVALVGATLAYFSITTRSNEGAIAATGATVSIDYTDGQQVIAQASALIPATWEVVQQAYTNNLEAINAQVTLAEELDRSNACLDSNNREVCSIYRFSVASDIERIITATLNNENNEFTYLAYAVRDVNTNQWLSLDGSNSKYMTLSTCDTSNSEETGCTLVGGDSTKSYNNNVHAVNSIFGYNGANLARVTINNNVKHTYDIVLFIKENNEPQNEDQGRQYNGTIYIDVIDPTGADSRITGCIGDNCD